MRVLVAEDHERLARAVAAGLRRYGMTVDVALDGDDALARLAASRYDVVVLDRDLPGTHGDEICRALAAERSESRVLMLTAASSVKDRVEGLGLGADDYLRRAVRLHRDGRPGRGAWPMRPGAARPEHLGYRDLTVDPERRLADRAGRRLELSPKEFAVLECLLVAEGRPVSAEELLDRVWDRGDRARSPRPSKRRQPPARQARRPADDRDSPRERLPHGRSVMAVAHPGSPHRTGCGCRAGPPGCGSPPSTAPWSSSPAPRLALSLTFCSSVRPNTAPRPYRRSRPAPASEIPRSFRRSSRSGGNCCKTSSGWKRGSPRLTPRQNQLTQGPQSARLPSAQVATEVDRQLTQVQHQLTQEQHRLLPSPWGSSHSPCIGSAQAGPCRPRSAPRPTSTPAPGQLRHRPGHRGRTRGLGRSLALMVKPVFCGPSRPSPAAARRISSTSAWCRAAGPRRPARRGSRARGHPRHPLRAAPKPLHEAQRHFVANASHELRTPVTAERTLLQVALDDQAPRPSSGVPRRWTCSPPAMSRRA